MESKKINQLATELAPALSDLTIIGDPTTGISKKITLSQMASLFTGTVEEYANVASFPLVGAADTIYIALDTNVLYRWDTTLTSYVELSPNIINSLVFNDANGFDGTISLVGSVATLTITTALTTGSVGFIGASGALTQDNDNFYWDNSNKRLGIGTKLPTTVIDVFGSGIIGRLNGTSTNNSFLGFASAGTNKWSIGNVQSDHRFRIYSEANTSELVSVLQTGEFGIGIANPTTKLHIDGGASALIANLDANVSVAKSISFRSDNSNRINLEVSGTESGSNAGANFFIRRYSDAGALIDTPLTITRSTGAATFSNTITSQANGSTFGTASTTGRAVIIQAGSTNQAIMFKNAAGGDGTLFVDGTSTSLDYNFNTYSIANALVIKNNGQIGIGTNSIDSYVSFDIANLSPSSNNVFLRVRNSATSEDTGFIVSGNTGGTAYEHRFGVNTIINSSDFIFHNSNSLGYRWYINSTQVFQITAGSGRLYSQPSYDNTYGAGANMYIASDGNIGRATSSLKYKTDIINYDKGLDIVKQLRPVYYKSKNETEKDRIFAGLIAEEVEELGLTEFVQYAEDGTPDALAYGNMIALAFKAIQELQSEIEILKAK